MIKILGRKNSLNVQKAMWTAAELELDIVREDIGGAYGGNDTAEYLALNPNGKVPVLMDGDFVLWESNAIVRYLSEVYGQSPWLPKDVQTRALCHQWQDWYTGTMNGPMSTVFWTVVRTPPSWQTGEMFDLGLKEAARLWGILDHHLKSRDFVCGHDLTFGDVAVGCGVYRWYGMEIDRPSLPSLEKWYARLQDRACYREHVMVPIT